MTRVDEILKYVKRDGFGLEVAPYFNPLAPKRDGFNVIILDVFDTATLRTRAIEDPFIPSDRVDEIELVDLVGSAVEISDLVNANGNLGKLDFIISSHNFEHLPNPIKFLKGCYAALTENGILSMAVPDVRACFDHFRHPSTLSDWLEAYFEDRKKPTAKQIFDGNFIRAYYHRDGVGEPVPGCSLNDNPEYYRPLENLVESFGDWMSEVERPSEQYTDCHCSTFFNRSLELMLRDLQYLGMIEFEIVEISETHYHEFFVHLRKRSNSRPSSAAFYAKRLELLREINQSVGWAGYKRWDSLAKSLHNKPRKKKKSAMQRVAEEGGRVKRRVLRYLS